MLLSMLSSVPTVVVFQVIGGNGNEVIFSFGSPSLGSNQVNFGRSSNKKFWSVYLQGTTSTCIGLGFINPADLTNTSTWYTAVLTYEMSSNTLSLSVNGLYIISIDCRGMIVGAMQFENTYIGGHSNGEGTYFHGNIAGMFAVDSFINTIQASLVVDSILAGEALLHTNHPRLISAGTVTGNGAMAPVSFVGGNVFTKMQWGSNSIPEGFTICSVSRYSGPNSGRILSCNSNPQGSKNWMHGHIQGRAGPKFYEVYKSDYQKNIQNNQDWVAVCGRNIPSSGSSTVIVNNITTTTDKGGTGQCALGINDMVECATELSDWQLSKLYVWDNHLSDMDFHVASSSLYSALYHNTERGTCDSCPVYSHSNEGASTCFCLPGAYAENPRQPSRCSLCPIGTYKMRIGPTACMPCPRGTYGKFSGQNSVQSCVPCKRGTFSTLLGSDSVTSCVACLPGKFHRNLGANSFKDCKTCSCRTSA